MNEELPIKYVRYESSVEKSALNGECTHILYLIVGRFTLESEMTSTAYEAGDICYLAENSEFMLEPDGGCEFIHIAMDYDFVRSCIGDYRFIICDSVREPNNDYSQVRSLTAEIASMYAENKDKYKLRILSLLYRIMDILKEDFSAEGIEEYDFSEKYLQRVREITNYIENNYSAAVTLETLADKLYLTPQYLSSFFKKYLHCSFRDYLREKRLFHACRDLRYTDDAIGVIAHKNGFSSASVFGRTFSEKYGITPVQYRNDSRTKKNKYPESSKRIRNVSAVNGVDILIDDMEKRKLNINAEILNASAVQNLTKAEFLQSINRCKSKLNIRYVRMQGVLSSAFIPKVIPEYTYYFSPLDRVLEALYKMDVIPWIELSNMISISPENIFAKGGESLDTYRFYGDRFFEMLEAVMAHITRIYPRKWLANWVFEVWKSQRQSSEQYVKNIKRIRKIIKSYIPEATIGGIGFPINRDIEEFRDILKDIRRSDVRLDYASIYGNLMITNGSGPAIPTADAGRMTERVRAIREVLKEEYDDIPLYMTEWNSFDVENMPIQQSCYQSAFVCKTVLELSELVDMSGYLYFKEDASDTMSLMKSSTINNFWGCGLIDKNGIEAPAYYSFVFLNQLGESLLERGENYCVTRGDDDSYRILLYGYAHVEPSKLLGLSENSSFAEVYDLFEEYKAKRVRLKIAVGESGKYRIERYRINRNNGSVLDIWIGGMKSSNISEREYLSRIQPPLLHQLEYFRKICKPEYNVIYKEVEETLTVEHELEAHEVCFYKITKLY